jgi:hypothetical protein
MVKPGSDKWGEVEVGAKAAAVEAAGLGVLPFARDGALAAATLKLGADDCATIRGISFTVPQTTAFSVIAVVEGVESAPSAFTVTSVADANPVSLKKLKDRIASPLLIILPLLVFNSAAVPKALRFLAGLGALASVVLLGAEGGASFQEEADALEGLFSTYDLSYVRALNATWWLNLAVVALLTAILLFATLPELLHWLRLRLSRRCTAVPPPALHAHWRFSLLAQDHATLRLKAAFSYVRMRLPRLRADPKGQQHHPAPNPAGAHEHGGGEEPEAPAGGRVRLAAAAAALLARAQAAAVALRDEVFLEDPSVAFFFPQRLLVAGVVSAIFTVCVSLLFVYWCAGIQEMASQLLKKVVALTGKAVLAVYYQRQRGGDKEANTVSAYLQWEAAGTSIQARCANQLLAVVSAVQDGAGGGGGGGVRLPSSLQEAIAGALLGSNVALTPEALINALSAQATEALQPVLEAAALRLRDCSLAGIALALALVAASWWRLLVGYKRTILGLRLGRGREFELGLAPARPPRHDTPSKAVGFVGVQGASSAVTLMLSAICFTFFIFLLSYKATQELLRAFFDNVLLFLLGSSFIIRLIKFLLFEVTMTGDGAIRFRRAFSALELYLFVARMLAPMCSPVFPPAHR